jgi:hypothetical protein
MPAGRLLKLLQQLLLKVGDGHFAGGNLFLGSAVIAKLAHPQPLLGAHGRPEHPAGHGARTIQVAMTGRRIERGTGLIIGKVLKAGRLRRIQQAGGGVARELRAKPFDGFPGPLNHSMSAFSIAYHKLMQSLLQTGRIQLINGENPYAALRAPWSADQPIPTASRGLRQRSVQNLNELRVPTR